MAEGKVVRTVCIVVFACVSGEIPLFSLLALTHQVLCLS
jgi:hypothetical protein